MRDSILLEQLFERVWYYPYENKELVIHEIQDLLRADVPIFTTFTDSRDLYSSTGEKMEDFLRRAVMSKYIIEFIILMRRNWKSNEDG